MEGKGRQGFVDWLIYGLGLLSIAILVYLFVGRYSTKIVVSYPEKPAQEFPVAKSLSPSLKQEEKFSSEITPRENRIKVEKTSGSKQPKKLLKKASRSCSRRISPNKYRDSTHYVCVSPKPSYSHYLRISGFTLFSHPHIIPEKEYNWTVINRYPSEIRNGLRKIGTYRVRRGDNIFIIAKRFEIRSIDIMSINKQIKNPDKLVIHSEIFIPGF